VILLSLLVGLLLASSGIQPGLTCGPLLMEVWTKTGLSSSEGAVAWYQYDKLRVVAVYDPVKTTVYTDRDGDGKADNVKIVPPGSGNICDEFR